MGSYYLHDYAVQSDGDYCFDGTLDETENIFVDQTLNPNEDPIFSNQHAFLNDDVPFDEDDVKDEENHSAAQLFSKSPITSVDRFSAFPEYRTIPVIRKMSFMDPVTPTPPDDIIDVDSSTSSRMMTIKDLLTVKKWQFDYDMMLTKIQTAEHGNTIDFDEEGALIVDNVTAVSRKVEKDHSPHRYVCMENGSHPDSLICDKCFNCYRNVDAYKRHVEAYEAGRQCVPFTMNCPFETCLVRCDCIHSIVEHVRLSHGRTDFVVETIDFPNLAQYTKWRDDMEESSQFTFRLSSKSMNKKTGFPQTSRYQCSLSGKNKQKPETDRIRNRYSKKMNRHCTAYYNVEARSDGIHRVRGCFKHIGHDTVIQKLPLTARIRKEIASYLLEGMDEQQICDEMRNKSEVDDRRHYIQLYEVRNIYTKLVKDNQIQEEVMTDVQNEPTDDDGQVELVSPKIEKVEMVEDFPLFVANEEVIGSTSGVANEYI